MDAKTVRLSRVRRTLSLSTIALLPRPRLSDLARRLARAGRALAFGTALALPAASAAALVTLGAPAVAEAAESKPIAVYVEGPDAESIRGEVLAVVPGSLKVLDESAFESALQKQGQKGQMGNVMAQPKQRGKLISRIRKATEKAGAQGAIIARVRKTRTGGRELWVLFVDPGSDEVDIDQAVPLGKSESERASALKEALDPVLKARASAEPQGDASGSDAGGSGSSDGAGDKPDDGTDKPDDGGSDSASTRTPGEMTTAIVVVGLSFQMAGRFFSFSDGLTRNLRPYDVFGAPMGVANLEFYPAGFGDVPVAKDIGLTASYTMAFGLDSATSTGEPIDTSFLRLNAGLRGRVRFGDAPSPTLGINAGFTLLNFKYSAPGELASEVPSASYKLLRFGLDMRIPAGPVALEFGGDFLLPLAGGEVYDRFTDPSVLGIEARGGVGVPLPGGFEVRLIGEYTRFFSAFAPVVGDKYVAGGALDQLVWIRLGAAYVY